MPRVCCRAQRFSMGGIEDRESLYIFHAHPSGQRAINHHMRRAFFAFLIAVVSMPVFAADITTQSVLAAMNEYRAKQGLAPLRDDPRLDLAASDRMRDMEDLGYWSH